MPNITQIQIGTTTYDIVDQIANNNINSLSTIKADIASPIFTGTPQAPTATTTNNSNQIATTKFVHDLISSAEQPIIISVSNEVMNFIF